MACNGLDNSFLSLPLAPTPTLIPGPCIRFGWYIFYIITHGVYMTANSSILSVDLDLYCTSVDPAIA